MDSGVCSLTFLDTFLKSPEGSRHLIVLFGTVCAVCVVLFWKLKYLNMELMFMGIIFHNDVKLF